METLERLGLTGNTLVYLTSDQGPHLEEISARGEVHRGWSGIFKGAVYIHGYEGLSSLMFSFIISVYCSSRVNILSSGDVCN